MSLCPKLRTKVQLFFDGVRWALIFFASMLQTLSFGSLLILNQLQPDTSMEQYDPTSSPHKPCI